MSGYRYSFTSCPEELPFKIIKYILLYFNFVKILEKSRDALRNYCVH